MIALLMTVAAVFSLVVVADETGANAVGFVVTVILMGFGFALFIGDSLERHIPSSLWDRLSLSREAARRWGVKLFNTVLSRIGWNKLIIAMREDRAARVKDWSPRPMRAAAAGHAWAFVLHAVTAVWAAVAGGWGSSVVLLVVGVVGHLFPILLQIRVLTRLREAQRRRR